MSLAVTVHSLRVLRSAGMIDVTRPGLLLRSMVATRRLGPIAGAVHASAIRAGEDVALIDEVGSLTYAELERRGNALARAFAAAGVVEGAVVAALCRDHRGVVEVMVAAGKVGARLVLFNTGFAKPQLADVAKREGVRILVADAEFLDLLDAVDDDVERFLTERVDGSPYPALDDLIAGCADSPMRLPKRQAGMVLLTGGTTGTPKGAGRRISSPLVAAQFVEKVPQRRGDIVFIAAPTFHGTGLSQFIIALAMGSTVVLRRRFDALQTVRGIAEHRATVLVLVPTMMRRILALGDEVLDDYDCASLRVVMSAGAALPADLGDRFMQRFGPVVYNLYGCTEVALATVATPADWAASPGCVGRPPKGVEVRLFDSGDEPIVEPDVSGRIFVDNGLKFSGYSGGGSKPMIGRLMGTGDTGHWDVGGRLHVDGRDDDMIVSGGENVFPAEIEELVSGMSGVADVATLPVPDEDFGTRLRMFVVADGATDLDEDAVKAYIKANLARFKVPREVLFVPSIPYTQTGKVARVELAALADTVDAGEGGA